MNSPLRKEYVKIPLLWYLYILLFSVIPLFFILFPLVFLVYAKGWLFNLLGSVFLLIGVIGVIGVSSAYIKYFKRAIIKKYGHKAIAKVVEVKRVYGTREDAGVGYSYVDYILDVVLDKHNSFISKGTLFLPTYALDYYKPSNEVQVLYLEKYQDIVVIVEDVTTETLLNKV